MSDIVERLEALAGVVGDVVIEARDEIVRLRAERDEAIALGHAISQSAQAAHDIWRKEQGLRKAAEAERDRLREALEHIRHYAVRLGAAWAEDRARAALKGDTP